MPSSVGLRPYLDAPEPALDVTCPAIVTRASADDGPLDLLDDVLVDAGCADGREHARPNVRPNRSEVKGATSHWPYTPSLMTKRAVATFRPRSAAGAILLISACAIAAACAAAGPALTPISHPLRRIEVPGLSVLPPQGDHWFLTSVPAKKDVPATPLVTFVKKLLAEPPTRPADVHLVYTRVTAYDLGDPRFQAPATFESPSAFVHWLREHFEKHAGHQVTGRQRLIGSDTTPDDSLGTACGRYRRLTELSGWARFPAAVFMLATRGLYCLHPEWPRYMIDVGYTQLYLKGHPPLPLDAEVEPFLRSPVFTSSKPMAETPTPAGGGQRARLEGIGYTRALTRAPQ